MRRVQQISKVAIWLYLDHQVIKCLYHLFVLNHQVTYKNDILISQLMQIIFIYLLREPPNNKQAIAFLISLKPKIDGAIAFDNVS